MTKKDFEALERQLEVTLPESYRSLVRRKPFKKFPELQVLFTDGARILEANRTAGLTRNFLVIGTDGAGNDYCLDLQAPDLSVYLRVHDSPATHLDNRVSSLSDFVSYIEDSLGLDEDEDSNRRKQVGALLAKAERLWFLPAAEAEERLSDLEDKARPIPGSLPGPNLGTPLAYLCSGLESAARREGATPRAERPPFHGLYELREIGTWLARDRPDIAIQRLAVSGKKAEEGGYYGAAAAFYAEANRLGANAQPAIDRLLAAGHPVDSRYAHFLEKLREIAEWPALGR
ncbi:hypothetical protein DYH09_21185 [bacterium CPR1]|nr:hypothetical protein [bacterium CPR1]